MLKSKVRRKTVKADVEKEKTCYFKGATEADNVTTKLVKSENRITEKYLKKQVKIGKERNGKTEQVIKTANHSNIVN